MVSTVRIGVLAESAEHISQITRLVLGAGYRVSATLQMGSVIPAVPDADIWVVNLDLDKDNSLAILGLLDAQDKHVIFDHDFQAESQLQSPGKGVSNGAPVKAEASLSPADIRRKNERRLALKIRQWVKPANSAETQGKRASDVWVLAASTGGPDAVIQFLKSLPKELKGVAFIYAQHIEPSGLSHLSKALNSQCPWPTCIVNRAYVVNEQTLYLVSPQYQIDLQEGGSLTSLSLPWAGPFSPSISQVIAKVARVYGAHGGAIVFSGMGNDGADSCTMLRHRGGQVWTQSAETCTVDSMPVSVEAEGCSQYQGSPEQLARQFIHFKQQGVQPRLG